MPPYTFAQSLKAYAALVGGLTTALLGYFTADTQVGVYLTFAAGVCTAIGTWIVPNAPTADAPDGDQPQVEDTH